MRRIGTFVGGRGRGGHLVCLTGFAGSADPAPQATAQIESRERLEGHGQGRLHGAARRAATKVEVWIENATPGTHGLHIHEKGDCSAPDATSAGPHFNAAGNPHAGPSDAKHHNGDLGNIESAPTARGTSRSRPTCSRSSRGPNSVVGRSVIFHEKADDLKTQPHGQRRGTATAAESSRRAASSEQ